MMKIFLGIVLFGLLASCSVVTNKAKMEDAYNPVVAHRGAFKKGGLPENSIAALREAIQLGCAGSEFDIRLSADDTLLINHDAHYRGMDIEKTSYKQLSAVPLPNGEVLPTLRQYLQAGTENNKQTTLVLEIKPSPAGQARGEQIAARVVQLVRDMNLENKVLYISFDYNILKKIVALNPAAHTQYLEGNRTPEQLKADGITGADYHFSVYKRKPEWVESAHQNGIILNAWTVNSKADMEWLLDKKFQYITTDEPELLLELLKSRAAAK
ncbi:MAG: glycerophosphodiester phosphodiesterase [Chitinophagaceae bacterium]